VEGFLRPTLRALMPAPEALRDLEAGAERIARAVVAGETIAVIGDYDVDGASATALLKCFLAALGAGALVHIPHRLDEGYGPSREAVSVLKARGAQLLITVDCGIGAHDPLDHASALGLDVVIVDHHQAAEVLPQAHAIINPNRQDDLSGLGYLAAVGVTLILAAAVNRALRTRGFFGAGRPEPDLLRWLDLVALGTVCDVVPLRGLNRAYVTQGLKVMAHRSNVGLAALADMARLHRRPDPHALGFVFGPRINAAGRLGSSHLGVELLTAADNGTAARIAQELERLNRERQTIELGVVEDAARQAEVALGQRAGAPVLVVAGEGWHPGVLGLVAARLKERFGRPAIALGFASGRTEAVGSGRSIAGVDLGAAVRAAQEQGLIRKGGGHAMAAGLTLARDRLDEFRQFLEERLAAEASRAEEARALSFDGALSASGATLALIELLERAGPYGAGNPAPLFGFPAHRILYADAAGADHVRCTLAASDGSRLKAVAFRSLGTELGELLLAERSHPLHVAGRLVVDDWGGSRAAQLLIEDAAEMAPPARLAPLAEAL
jgi:single-stranded-DNA-specific exonuclease